ncbi:hypothetical protein Micbo1qcDRAFT_207114 [Microdochium bolleyi]|uniref:Rhodopsin domain-containing protein n=1 Tax=Microdochium bolleyi TaxID=196109 RepID=A0A136IU12_9PEZI|nr:hypothetical protein Micbo1qcDRAFT_207114 [Microdochium bolleyi]
MSTAEAFTLLSLSLAIICVRTWHRWHLVGFGGFQLDDYVMPLSGALFAIVTSLAYMVGANYQGLTNSYMTDGERAALDPNSVEASFRIQGSKIQVIGWSLYTMELWVLKLCITAFYSRLTVRLSNLERRVKFAYIIIGVSYVIVALSILLGCQPFQKNWQINPNPGPLCQPTNSPVNVLMVYSFNVVTDLYLLSIPMPLLWQVSISLRRKITLSLLFGGAIFVITAATIRVVAIMTAGAEGALAAAQWACREIFVSVVVTNLPIVQPLLRSLANKTGLSMLFSSSGNSGKRGGGGGGGGGASGVGRSYPLSSNPGHHSTAFGASRGGGDVGDGMRHGHAFGEQGTDGGGGKNMTTVAAWDSDEHILMDDSSSRGEKGAATVSSRSASVAAGDKSIVVGTEVRAVKEPARPDSRSSMSMDGAMPAGRYMEHFGGR